ncbi:extracellular matrix [Mactra antiquata]
MPMIIRYRVIMELFRTKFAYIIFCVFVLFSIQEISGIATLEQNDIIIVNRPINVFFGRSVFIDPINDLRLHVRAGDTCMLTVLDNEQDISFKPGKLSLSNFACNFGPEQISYTHFGGERAGQDVTRLLLRYDSVTQTLIIPFSIVVNIIIKPLEIVDKYNAITVNRNLGMSTPIGLSTIRFSDFERDDICKISAISKSSGLPQYGYLTNNSHTLTNVDCDVFLTFGIRYKHAQARGSNRDFIPLTVQLFHGNGDLKNQEFFQIPVDILSGYENTPPEPSRTSTFVMDSINQFVMTAITPEIVSAVDDQSPNDKLLFNITLPLGPNEGIVVNTDNRHLPINTFFQHEVNDLKIAYIPPSIDSNIKRLFQFELNIIDTDGLASDPLPMMIIVYPMSTKAPVVTKNTGIQLVEGQSRPIKSPEVLVISDEDNLMDVKISHIDGLKHGHLVLPPRKIYFTVKDLEEGTVVYHHDDSDSFSDNIIFHMTDGNSDVQFLFPVTIYPKDDRHPTLNVNTGLELRKNDIVEINQFVLSATDTDTNDLSILFTIEGSTSKMGIIVKRQFQIPDDVENWHFKDGIYEHAVNNFLQNDILEGKIYYRHVGDHISDVVTDKIHLTLSDSGTPPNISPLYELVVKIHPVDDIPPYLYPNTQLYLEVEESQMVHFRRRSFRYADEDTNDREIMFTITRQPYDTYADGPSDAGAVVHCDDFRRVVTQFQQSQINHQKLCYRPPSVELGLTTRIVKFDFDVEDISGNILPDQSYTVVIKPVNNQPPVVRNSGAMVLENDVVRITKEMLEVSDKDTEPKHIIIIVRTIPNYGILYKESDILAVGNRFKQDDIDRGKIFYRNTGENVEVLEDNFSLDVSDGIHFIPITFRIRIQPTDDEPAYLEGSGSAGVLNIRLNVNEKNSVTIRPGLFTIRDPDSDVMAVTYVIQKYPEHGTIYKNGVRVSYFSQRDIWLGHVTYEHNKEEIGLKEVIDQVTLSIYNNDRIVLQDGTRLVNINMYFTVLPVNDYVPVVRLGPSLDVLEGNRTFILPKHIDVKDEDTVEDEILCIITDQPQHGFISNKAPRAGSERSRESLPVSAFDVKNLRHHNIMYVQSVHKGVEPRRDQFSFYCTDGMNLSVEKTVDVDITPTNDEEPEVFIREFIGSEGMEIRIDSPILNAVDKDEPPETLQFIITKQPTNGKIFQQTRTGDIVVNNFTLGDIEKFSTIIYEHDDSETQSDYFEFTLTDGKHSLSRSVPIIIFPVDDETPRLAINNGLEIENLGDHKRITNKELKAEDIDSFEGNITYIIRLLPQQGYMARNFGRGRNEHNLTLWSNFTQNDIDEGRITYVHTGTEAKRDLLKFDVTDGLNPLIGRNFYITIKGMDIIYPEVINKGIELPEGGTVLLTTDMISATDTDTPDEKLTYTITKTPQHGYVEFVERAGHPIVSFSQLDLAANRVRYVHNSEYEIKMDSFEFELTDGFNPVYRTFRIALTDVDNKNPVLMYTVLRLKEGTSEIITPFELKAVDMDTPDEKIVFTITQVPLHGNLLFNFSRIVSRFTLKDLTENLISYQHDGSDTMSDSFIFTVTDGTHAQFYLPGSNLPTRKPQEMDIEIIPVDNGIPHVSANTGADFLTAIDVGLGFTLTCRNLYSEDQDSENEELEYSVTVTPNHGYLRNTEQGNDRITSWTQGDINEQRIQYVLNPGENATSDTFFFQVSDKGRNALKNQPFHLNWGWISFRQSKITVNETEEILEVTLLRRGYLSETSFVTINVTERTANIGKDVALQFAEQVQFNPGQTEKTWRLPLRDDDIYEVEETLVLQMTDPVSAVLEYPEVAMVTIVDPEDESVVFFPEKVYNIDEKIGDVEIPIHRTGDLSNELMVVCFTIEGTARGTPPNKMQSYSDYLSRPENHNSMVRFDKGEDKRMCTVTIIDDSLFEEEETFSLVLGQPMGGRVGADKETTVVIGPDPADGI